MGQLDFNYGYNDPDYATHDPPTYTQACMGLMVCPHCGRALICGDAVSEHEFQLPKENEDMIPRGQSNDTDNSRGGFRRKKSGGLRYLSVDMLSTAHQLAQIADARVQDDNFKPNGPQVVVVKLKFRSEFILWTLRVNNPALETIGDAFGDDEQTWKGHQVELFIEEDAFDGKKWIRCEAVTEGQPTKRGKSSSGTAR